MKLSFWSDEDRWFVPRAFGLGYSLNLKYVAKRLGWIHTAAGTVKQDVAAESGPPHAAPKTQEDRLRERIEASKSEELR